MNKPAEGNDGKLQLISIKLRLLDFPVALYFVLFIYLKEKDEEDQNKTLAFYLAT